MVDLASIHHAAAAATRLLGVAIGLACLLTLSLRLPATEVITDDDWSPLGAGVNGIVNAIVPYRDGIVVAGEFTQAGGASANRIAYWNGTAWSALGTGLNGNAYGLAADGDSLYVGGTFTQAGGLPGTKSIARWNGSAWSTVGSGVTNSGTTLVQSLAVSSGKVYAGGYFSQIGGVSAQSIAAWDGTSWSALGSGANSVLLSVRASGPGIVIGGLFTQVGGVPGTASLAYWNGSAWSSVGGGLGIDQIVRATAGSVGDGGLYVGGQFAVTSAIVAQSIARWNGTSWSTLDNGFSLGTGNGTVNALVRHGQDLYAAGLFPSANGLVSSGGVPASNIARWDGQSWSGLGSGTNLGCVALAVVGNTLYVGGSFTTAGGKASSRVARVTLPGPAGNTAPIIARTATAGASVLVLP
jgi:hypothetical protein